MEQLKKEFKELINKLRDMPDENAKLFSGVCFIIEPKVEGEEFEMVNSKGICFGRPEYVAACLVGILNQETNKKLKMYFLSMMLDEIMNDQNFQDWNDPEKNN